MNGDLGNGRFTWLAGIEDTCIDPPAGSGMSSLDEYDLTGHTDAWRDDLEAARDLGATAVRYGVEWPKTNPAEGEFDWTMLDERLAFAAGLGLTVVADLVHYGTPTWLADAFADPRYPAAVAEFAGRFAERYRGVVDHLTPLNEPVTTASFAGLRGVWPPALTGWSGWTTVVLGIVEGMAASIRAIRRANADAVIVHVEASALYSAADARLDREATLLTRVGMLPTDLLLGRVDRSHPMHDWLRANGADADRLDRLRIDPPDIDILGVNYYPDLSPRQLIEVDGRVDQIAVNRGGEGLLDSLRSFSSRYGLPLLITETSIEGDDDVRGAWVDASVRAVRRAIDDGLDIRGYTWWPLFDFVDWSYASGGRNVEEFQVDRDVLRARSSASGEKSPFLRRMGLLRLEEQPDGRLVRRRTSAADRFAAFAREESESRRPEPTQAAG